MPVQEDPKLQMIIQELVRRTNDESRRLRSLEQRVQALEGKANSIEDMFLSRMKKIESFWLGHRLYLMKLGRKPRDTPFVMAAMKCHFAESSSLEGVMW